MKNSDGVYTKYASIFSRTFYLKIKFIIIIFNFFFFNYYNRLKCFLIYLLLTLLIYITALFYNASQIQEVRFFFPFFSCKKEYFPSKSYFDILCTGLPFIFATMEFMYLNDIYCLYIKLNINNNNIKI